MAEKYMFFNSTATDRRRHTAGDMAEYWSSFLSTGLISRDKVPLLRVTANGENNILNIGVGSAIIKGHLYINDSDLKKTVPLPEGLGKRIDRVVLRLDNRRGVDDSRYIKIFIKEGTEDAPPELEREVVEGTTVLYELSLAQVKLNEGVTYITQDDITDERLDEELCGMASSLVSIPTEIFGEQWRDFVDEYYTWFEGIKNEMYATEKEVRQRDHALKREIAYLEMMMEADRRIKNGVVFADNFKGNPHNIEYLKGKAELAEDVEPNDRELIFINAHDFHTGIKEITIYDQEKQERLDIDRIEGDMIYLSKPIVNGFEVQSMLFESVHQIEDGYMKVGEVPSGMTIEINNIDLGDIYDEWYIYDDHFYMIKGRGLYYYNIRDKVVKFLMNIDNELIINSPVDSRVVALKDGLILPEYQKEGLFKLHLFIDGVLVDTKEDLPVGLNDKYLIISESNQRINCAYFLEITSGRNRKPYLIKIDNGRLSVEPVKVGNGTQYREDNLASSNRDWLFTVSEDVFLTRRNIGTDSYQKVDVVAGSFTKIGDVSTNFTTIPTINANNSNSIVKVRNTDGRTEFWVDGTNTVIDNLGTGGVPKKIFDDGYYTYIVYNNRYARWANNEIEVIEGEFDTNNIIAPHLFDLIKEKPFQLIDGRYANGRFFEGVIFEPEEADIRFKVPKTKEVVAYIENNSLGEYSGWFNQHSTEDASMDNEIQMIGTSTDDYDTFRLTVKRDSVDEDNRITRILGGVL